MFFEVTEDTYYYPGKQFCTSDRSKPKGYSFIEAFHTGNISCSVFIGFLWYHMRWCKDENTKGGNISTMPCSFLKNDLPKSCNLKICLLFPIPVVGCFIFTILVYWIISLKIWRLAKFENEVVSGLYFRSLSPVVRISG